MIQVTFTPGNSAQAELIGKLMAQYLTLEAPTDNAAQAVETAAAEPAAPKRTRAAKPAATGATEQASTSTAAPAAAAEAAPEAAKSQTTAPTSAAEEGNAAAETSAPEATAAPAASSEGSAKTYTLEEVRAKLAELSKGGKQAQVVGLIAQFGAKKLTDVPAEKYGQLMTEAEALA